MEKILLDTNFLMACFQFKADIFSEIERTCPFSYKAYVLDKTMKELESIAEKQKGKDKDAAKIALKLLKIKNVEVIETNSKKYTDDAILDYAKKGYIAATQDKDLKRMLLNQGSTVITLRQKKKIIWVRPRALHKVLPVQGKAGRDF